MSDELEALAILPPCEAELRVLHSDAAFLITDKPANLLSVPGRHPSNRDSVIVRLLDSYPTASIVHRLDFNTSGIMVVPLSKMALSHISKQFQARTVKKNYTAVVNGLVKDDNGIIDLPIASDAENRPKYKICHDHGKKSVTEFFVLSRDEKNNSTRLCLLPITGRSHQLRLHMHAIGHPILGCEFYADNDSTAKSPRLLLHATDIEFIHPVTQNSVSYSAPPDF